MEALAGAKEKFNIREMTEMETHDYIRWESRRLRSISNQIVEYFP